MQWHVTDREVVKSEWAEYDLIVDAFLVWYNWASEQKRKESLKKSHEADPPAVSGHAYQFKAAHP